MTEHTNGGAPDCLACAVRALTEGTPKIWTPGSPGHSVSGPVLAVGTTENRMHPNRPFTHLDLWLGGLNRIRVVAFGAVLEQAIEAARPAIGDRVTIRYDGFATITRGQFAGRRFRSFTVSVGRGHH